MIHLLQSLWINMGIIKVKTIIELWNRMDSMMTKMTMMMIIRANGKVHWSCNINMATIIISWIYWGRAELRCIITLSEKGA